MLPLERKNKLLEYLKENRSSTVSELAKLFNVHEATIRRDLTKLEKQGLMKRTHGGVIFEEEVFSEPPFQERETEQYEEKKRIGKLAASLIEAEDTIILDSGTTTLHIAKAIKDRRDITVITNDINIAAILRYSKNKVVVTGGVLFPQSYILNGFITDETLETIHVQKAFIGTPAIHHDKGITHFDEYLVSAKRKMISSAKEKIVVTDHTKVSRISTFNVATINELDALVVDDKIKETELLKWKETDIKIHLA